MQVQPILVIAQHVMSMPLEVQTGQNAHTTSRSNILHQVIVSDLETVRLHASALPTGQNTTWLRLLQDIQRILAGFQQLASQVRQHNRFHLVQFAFNARRMLEHIQRR